MDAGKGYENRGGVHVSGRIRRGVRVGLSREVPRVAVRWDFKARDFSVVAE